MSLRVLDVGFATTIQDQGRRGFADLGVPRAGAVDRRGLDLANRLVGNDVEAAAFETLGGLTIEAAVPLVVATSTDGLRHTLPTGGHLSVPRDPDGRWVYVAIRGGIAVDPVLRSRSHDTLSGLGPPPLRGGLELPVGADPRTELTTDLGPVRHDDDRVRLWEGPRLSWFDDALDRLVDRAWTVTGDVNRVGVRLEAGTFPATTAATTRMASEGLIEGAIQLTPSGEPIVMLSNHPTTGGYPVVAVVDPDDQHIVANSRPGARLRFRRV